MAALDEFGPFDGQSKNEDFWRDYFRHLTGSGVVDGVGSEFAVVERGAGANLSVDVGAGECFIRGHWGESTGTKNMAIGAADATNPRIDRVVLRADFTANTMSIEVLEGTPGAIPAAPALTQSSSRWEISLAQISVPATDTTIGSGQITDERTIITWPIARVNSAPTDGQVLTFDTANGWQPETPSSGSSLPGAAVYQTGAQTIATGTLTALTFAAETDDNGGFHDNVTNNNRLTVPTGEGGLYMVAAALGFSSAADGLEITIVCRKNGVNTLGGGPYAQTSRAGAAGSNGTTFVGWALLAAGDYIDVCALHQAGGNEDTDPDRTGFALIKVNT